MHVFISLILGFTIGVQVGVCFLGATVFPVSGCTAVLTEICGIIESPEIVCLKSVPPCF